MSDTPRTDAGEYWKVEEETWVPIEFGRQLERELNEANERYKSLKAAADGEVDFGKTMMKQRDQWREVAGALIPWLKSEMLDDDGAIINARDHGEWDRLNRLEGHRDGLLHVVHHLRAAFEALEK